MIDLPISVAAVVLRRRRRRWWWWVNSVRTNDIPRSVERSVAAEVEDHETGGGRNASVDRRGSERRQGCGRANERPNEVVQKSADRARLT